MRNVSQNPGYYGPDAWPGAQTDWGATASSLPIIGGVIMLREFRAGIIAHALALNLPETRAGVFAWPAQRTDGVGGNDTIPEGARLRLDPRLDLNSLSLPPVTRLITEAAQRYGLIVRDQTGHGIGLFAEDPTQYGGNQLYYAPTGIFRGEYPSMLLKSFPWRYLQVLRMHLCSAGPCVQ
jgi:hypothetical protein